MSNYPPTPPGYPYNAPPPSQPHGGPPPTSQPYPAGSYGGPPSGPPPHNQPSPYSAPPGAPYSAPPGAPYSTPPGAPYSAPPGAPYSAPPGAPYSAPPGAPYSAPPGPQHQHYGGYPTPPPPSAPYGAPFAPPPPSAFPPGTDPNVIAYFQMADQDGSGFIDDKELQRVLSSYNESFGMRTVHLLMYLFTNSNVRKIGPNEFTQVYYCLQNWRAMFERFDRDRSGKIDSSELRDALLNIGFSVSPVVLDLLVSKFDKTGGKNKAIGYDNFIECCLTVKGLTEKFKEKDTSLTGSATFSYETFMLTVLPFLIA